MTERRRVWVFIPKRISDFALKHALRNDYWFPVSKKSASAVFVFAAAPFATAVPAEAAGWFTQPGELAGLSLGAPLPESMYFIDISSYGDRTGGARLGDTIPVLAWSIPWNILGGKLQFFGLAPSAFL